MFHSVSHTFFFVLMTLWMLMSGTLAAIHSKTPLTKCCFNHQAYMAELDVCRDWKRPITHSKLSEAPPVYSLGRSSEPAPVHVETDSFVMTHQLKRCPVGYVGMSSPDFKFYEDGSIFSLEEHITYQAGEFCIQETFPSGRLVARYCVRDPCNRTDVCIRKCCPNYTAFDISSTRCINHLSNLTVTLYNNTGYPLHIKSEDLFIRDGIAPQCRDGFKHRLLDVNDYIMLPNGLLDILQTRRCSGAQKDGGLITDEYCIDHFVDVNGTSGERALVCVEDDTNSTYPIFLFVSSFFLVATFAVYALIPEIRNIHGVVIMCYVVSRAGAYLIFGTLQLVGTTRSTIACRAMSILIHFSYLSTYTWLNAVCFDIWWTLKSMQPCSSVNQAIRQNNLGKPFVAYSLYSWGLAAIIVIIGQVLDYYKISASESIIRSQFGEDACWFSSYGAMFAYVYGPVCILILVDIIFFVMTSVLLRRAGIGAGNRHAREKYRLRVIFGLFVLKIVSWLAEFITYAIGCLNEASYAIDVIETLSSVLTFAIFVCKPNVWRLFKQKCPCLERLERILPYSANANNRCSTVPTLSTNVSSREHLHADLIKSISSRFRK
ncbi:G-protein coupled receptor Mth2-like [Daphnia carinata]|uniref:G-protein coupled receptor Mth2-like n=1 Tax=Daphnia carinata TaxID=120202 RepID=UPI0025803AF3|nr:G-protein coupled receptor Mth2-like [Daphnia carinata]